MAERAQILIRAKDETAGAFASVQRNFSSVHGLLSQLAPQIAAAFSIGGVIAFAKSALDSADALNDMSQKTGLSVESLSKWKVVAEQSNTTLEGLVPGFKGLATNMEAAARGGQAQADAFARLGVPVRDASGGLRAMDAVMLDLAEKFSTMPDGAQKSALAVRIFGKAGLDMIPVLNEGRDGIEGLMQAAEDMGVVFSTEAAAAADEFNDSLGLMKRASTELAVQFVNQTARAISQVASVMADAARQGGIFAAVVRGYGEAWKILLFGSDPSQIDQQREFLEDTEKRLAAARERLNAAMQDAQRFPSAVSPEVMNRLRTEVAGLELTARAAQQSLALMEAKRAVQAPPATVTPTGELTDPNAAAKAHQQDIKDKIAAMQAEIGWRERNDQSILDAIEVGEQERQAHVRNTLEKIKVDAEYRARSDADILAAIELGDRLTAEKDEQRKTALASLMDDLRTENEIIEQDFAQKNLLLKSALDQNLITQAQYYNYAKRLDVQYTQDKLKLKNAETVRLQQLVTQSRRGELTALRGLFAEAVPLMQSKSKTLFRIGKAAALAEATVSTAQAIANALAVKPFPLGLALAALAAAKGMVQIQAIRSAEIGGGGGAVGTFDASPTTGLPTSQFPEAPLGPSPVQQQIPVAPRNVFITLSGSGRYSAEEVRELIGAINEQLGDNVRLHVN